MSKILILFCHPNRKTAYRIRTSLHKKSYVVAIIDLTQVKHEAQFVKHQQLIHKADVVIPLLDNSFLKSKLTKSYLAYIKKLEIQIIPILVAPITIRSLSPKSYIDATEKLDNALYQLLWFLEHPKTSTPVKSASNTWLKVTIVTTILAFICILLGFFSTTTITVEKPIPTNVGIRTQDNIPTQQNADVSSIIFVTDTSQVHKISTEILTTPTSSEPSSEEIFHEELPQAEKDIELTEAVEVQDAKEIEVTQSVDVQDTTEAIVASPTPINVDTNSPTSSKDFISNFNLNPKFPSTSSQNQETVNLPEIVDFKVSEERGEAPFTVDFFNASQGNFTSVTWDFDDDGTVDSMDIVGSSFVYEQPGSYKARLVVTRPDESQAQKVTRIKVDPASQPTNNAFKADFKPSIQRGNAPLSITFTSTSAGDIQSYNWDFNGDGTIDSTEEHPSAYVYEEPGIYFSALTVDSKDGDTRTKLDMIIVDDAITDNTEMATATKPASVTINVLVASPTSPYIYAPITFVGPSTSTPTGSPTATPSHTPTLSATPTASVTEIPSPTVPTETVTPSPTVPTETVTPSPTVPTETVTPSPTVPTETVTPSWTPTATATL